MQRDPDTRRELLIEATTAMLQRAQGIELWGSGSESECVALEEAADHLRKMKLAMTGDRSGKHV